MKLCQKYSLFIRYLLRKGLKVSLKSFFKAARKLQNRKKSCGKSLKASQKS